MAVSDQGLSGGRQHLTQLADAGSRQFKNIDEPVNVWTWQPAGSDSSGRDPKTRRRCRRNIEPDRRRASLRNLSDSTDEYFSTGSTRT